MQNEPEVILNLWYIVDQSGLLISLKARAYVMSGTDDQKLAFLNERALLDFMIAEDFLLPPWLVTNYHGRDYNTALYSDIKLMGKEFLLFEHCIKKIEDQISKVNGLKLAANPLVSITPLLMDDNNLVKVISGMTVEKF